MIIVRSLFRKENHSRHFKYWLCSSDMYLDQCLHPSPKVERPSLQGLRITAANIIQMVPSGNSVGLLCRRQWLGAPVCEPRALFRGLHVGHPCSRHLGMTSCSRSLCTWHNFKGVFTSVQIKKAEHSSSGRACLLGAGAGIRPEAPRRRPSAGSLACTTVRETAVSDRWGGGGFHQRADQSYTQNAVPCLGRVASWPACSEARVRPGPGTAACAGGHSTARAERCRGRALLSMAARGTAPRPAAHCRGVGRGVFLLLPLARFFISLPTLWCISVTWK